MKAAQCGFNGASVNTLIVLTATLSQDDLCADKNRVNLGHQIKIFPHDTFHFEALGGKPNSVLQFSDKG